SAPDRFPYPRPGKTNADVRLGITGLRGGATTWIDWDRARFPYVAKVAWDRGGPPVLYVLDRPQRTGRLLAVHPVTGATRTLVEEHDEAWVNVDPSAPRWLADGSGFLWTTESRGAWQIELRDPQGAVVRVLTPPSPGYSSLVEVDVSGRRVIW